MKKRVYTVIFALLLLLFSVVPVAAKNRPRLVDKANLLTDNEEMKLLAKLDEISERQQVDLVVVTKKSINGKTPMAYADDFYDKNGYGFGDDKDGILFLISMEERDWYISTTGFGITAVTDADLEYMSEKFLDDLAEGEYAAAFTTFAKLCDDFITQARTDVQSGSKVQGADESDDFITQARTDEQKEPFQAVRNLVIALGIGFIISLLITELMRSSLKTVYSQPKADSYIKAGSMKLTKESDLFLYRHVERREKPKDNNSRPSHPGGSQTHISSSGRTHGGGGGKF